MDADSARKLLVSYIDEQLDPDTVAEIDQCLANDAGLRRELSQLREVARLIADGETLEPDGAMRTRFDAFLRSELAGESSDNRGVFADLFLAFSPMLRVAAAIALVAGSVGIFWFVRSDKPEPALPAPSTIVDATKYGPSDRLASGRLQWISGGLQEPQPEPEFRDALLEILGRDQNGAVRLAALKALSGFSGDPVVRGKLIEMLPEENDPMMQIALIEILSKTGTPEARSSIEQLLLRRDVREFVKGQAQLGLTYY